LAYRQNEPFRRRLAVRRLNALTFPRASCQVLRRLLAGHGYARAPLS